MGEGFSVLQGTKTQSSLYGLQSSIRRVRSWAEQAAEAGEAASAAVPGAGAEAPAAADSAEAGDNRKPGSRRTR